jgi:eukaryotic-like serine/threonine-protein kinase
MMEKIKLPRGTWLYDPKQPLGPKGGFGIVYAGNSPEYGDLAIKQIFIDIQDEAHREIRIADELIGKEFDHVIPFYDAGFDAEIGKYFVVMARAEKSLQQEINSGRTLTEHETIEILLQIVNGLLEVPELVHRDLKPGNVLCHQSKWKVADFGIARFVEESTSLKTLKECLTPQYAAPEQWEYQRPTNAVDVYALGCIGYALINGQPPFIGLNEDIKDKHLHKEPPSLNSTNALLRSLLSTMLRKNPENRPSLTRVKKNLEQVQKSKGRKIISGFSELSSGAAEIAEESAKEEAMKLTEMDEQIRRENISLEAMNILAKIVDILFEQIIAHAPDAKMSESYIKQPDPFYYALRMIKLGSGILSVDFNHFAKVQKDTFSQSKWNVYSGSIILVKQESNYPYEWGANLWYTDLGKSNELRWWEVTYMTHPLKPRSTKYEPFAVYDLFQADRAAVPYMDVIQFGSKPKPIDDDAQDDFFNRWVNLLAKAARGELRSPSRLPID